MILVVDTETTGLPDFAGTPEDEGQPRLVQLGAILMDASYNVRAELNMLVATHAQFLTPEVEKIHGIDKQTLMKYGFNELDVMVAFNYLCRRAEVIVAHNLRFDAFILGTAFHHAGIAAAPPEKKYCTMVEMAKSMGSSTHRISLANAHMHAFKKGFDNAHDAMADVRACARLYRWLQNPETPGTEPPEVEPSDALEFDHDTPMPFGKHRGVKLRNVDPSYLRWLKREGCNNPLLQKYLENQKDL